MLNDLKDDIVQVLPLKSHFFTKWIVRSAIIFWVIFKPGTKLPLNCRELENTSSVLTCKIEKHCFQHSTGLVLGFDLPVALRPVANLLLYGRSSNCTLYQQQANSPLTSRTHQLYRAVAGVTLTALFNKRTNSSPFSAWVAAQSENSSSNPMMINE